VYFLTFLYRRGLMIMAGSLGYLSTTNGWHQTVAKPTKRNVRQQVVWR